jgi:transcriptional regulator with XRE-family HTH domain
MGKTDSRTSRATSMGRPPSLGPLGARVRSLRRSRAWNLAELSKRSGIALSTLSKVENGDLSLNYERLQHVAAAFEMSLADFLSDPGGGAAPDPGTARISWARRGSGAEVETAGYRDFYLCENLLMKRMQPIMARCKARTLGEFGPLLRHQGEEFIMVIKGKIAVHTEFYGVEVLDEGEGVYLDSRMGHAYLNAGEGEAWICSVNYQPAPTNLPPAISLD